MGDVAVARLAEDAVGHGMAHNALDVDSIDVGGAS